MNHHIFAAFIDGVIQEARKTQNTIAHDSWDEYQEFIYPLYDRLMDLGFTFVFQNEKLEDPSDTLNTIALGQTARIEMFSPDKKIKVETFLWLGTAHDQLNSFHHVSDM